MPKAVTWPRLRSRSPAWARPAAAAKRENQSSAVADRGLADQVVGVALGEAVDRLQGLLDRLAADPAEHVDRPGPPVGEAVAAGQHQHLAARLGQPGGGGQPGRAGPDDDHVGPHQPSPARADGAAASSGTPSPWRSKMPR